MKTNFNAKSWQIKQILVAAFAGLSNVCQSQIVINEIHYNPDLAHELVEFIELHNTSNSTVDISGWYFSSGISYTFPAGSQIPANGYAVVTEDSARRTVAPTTSVQAKYGVNSSLIYGSFTFESGLNNNGETIALRASNGLKVDEVGYQLGFPWPIVGDAVPDDDTNPGSGHSLQLIHPDLDNDLGGSWRSAYPTPGAQNASVYAPNIPPQIRQVDHNPKSPTSSDIVTLTAKVTDPDGVSSVTLHYQLVEPGNYIPIRFPSGSANPDYESASNWTDLTMYDDGTHGDAFSGDSVYTAEMPSHVQGHRNLVRYRITAEDAAANSLTVPYADDAQPNFAYFIYDGVPSYTADGITYPSTDLTSIQQVHILSRSTDISTCHSGGETDYIYPGTVVYNGDVYDHVFYRIKGAYSFKIEGKKKWKFNFHRGHRLKMRDDYGDRYQETWDKLNLSGGTCPYWQEYGWDKGVDGMILNEAATFKFFNLAGVPSPNTSFLHIRVVDDASEDGADQYSGDFWGLYIGVEQEDNRFINEHDLPDGNLYKMAGTAIGANQGTTEPDISGTTDVDAFVSGYQSHPSQSWWELNLNLDGYYRYHTVDIVANNSDARPQWNCSYYHNPITDKWSILPWDLDLTYEYATHTSDNEHLKYSIEDHSALNLEYKNRAREIQDLLFNDEQANQALDELATIVDNPATTQKFHAANRSRWEYDPYVVSKGRDGLFYKSTHFDNFPEVVSYMKDFISVAGLGSSYGGGKLTADIADSAIPDTPTVTFTGSAGFPENDLTFETTAFSDPQGSGTFSAMQWRIAEIEPISVATNPPSGGGTASLIAANAEWKFFKGTQEPSNSTSEWRQRSFNDNGWRSGDTPIGYGTAVTTELTDMRDNYTSVYLRKEFEITNPADIETLRLKLNYDEGFNIWINGTHLDSVNVSGENLPFDATASSYIPGQTSSVLTYSTPGFLSSGTNVITIQLLNYEITSSDCFFDPVLEADLVEVPGDPGGYNFVNTGKPGKYEIDAIWESPEITTYNPLIRIPAEGVKEGKTYRVRCKMKDTTGRWSHWSAPNQFIAGEALNADILSYLRVSEVMYNNADADFIELKNIGTVELDLGDVSITDGVAFSFAGSRVTTLAAGDFVLVVKDQAEFEAQYGTGLNSKIAGVFVNSSLSNGGEAIKVEDFWNGTIIQFEYNDSRGWPVAADGAGHSIVPLSLAMEDQPLGTLDYGANWRQSSYIGGSPGTEDPAAPSATAVINELMAHTDHFIPPHESNDWLELYNPGSSTLNLGIAWYLSDDMDNLKQYALPASELLSGAYITYDQVNHFNPDGTGPAGWGLNKAGDTLFLSYLPGTSADRVVDSIQFKGQENDVSLSRYPDGGTYWFHTSPHTRNGTNANAVEHVVISEIMYHPLADTATEIYDEYIELYNPTNSPTELWTVAGPWALSGGVSYTFPPATTLGSGDRIILVDFDPANSVRRNAFESAYNTGSLTAGVNIFGPWSGDLSNNGERLILEKPQDSDDPLSPQDISWIIVDECIYNDYWPWPVNSDGTGDALHRISSMAYRSGNDPANWQAALPAPGNFGVIVDPDSDGDGMPNDWEVAHSLDPNNPADANVDSDGDGRTNIEEYWSGTDPRDPNSVLQFEWIGPTNSLIGMHFIAVAEKTYTIQYRPSLDAGAWQILTNLEASASTVPSFVSDPAASTNNARFYRLETP